MGALHRECRFWEKKESDKQIIHHKSTKHIPYISITGFTSLLSNKKHTHSIRPGILTTTKVLNYWGYLIICKTTEFRDSIPGINEFTDLPGIVKQIRELTDTLCGRSDLIRVRFTGVRGDLYSGTITQQWPFQITRQNMMRIIQVQFQHNIVTQYQIPKYQIEVHVNIYVLRNTLKLKKKNHNTAV